VLTAATPYPSYFFLFARDKIHRDIFFAFSVKFLQHIRDFFGISFKLDTKTNDEDEDEVNMGTTKVIMTCLGIGYTNINKRTL